MGITDLPSNTSHSRPTTQGQSQEQSSIVEPRSILGAAPTEEMFLSPRVIDAGAFAKYSDMLKSIIAQANSQGRTLEDFNVDAQAMIKRCESTSEAINKRMQSGLRMIKMIDERAARTDLLLDKVQSAQPNSDAFTTKIDELIEQRLSDTEQRLEQMVSAANARVEAADERARKAIELSDGHALKLAELTTRIEGQLDELDARIENTRRETSKTLEEILDRTNTVSHELNNSLDQVISRSHEAGSNLAAKIDEASLLTDSRIAELNCVIEPLLHASQQAMRTLGMDPDNPVFADSPLARIEHLVERGETQSASLDRVYRQLEDLQSQAEGVKAVFGLWLVDAAGELDVLEARKDTLVGPISEAADKVAELGPDVEHNIELASTKLSHLMIEQKTLRQAIQAASSVADDVTNRMTNESGQLQALLDGSLHKLSTRVEQAGVWLGALIQHAESLASTLPSAGRMEFGSTPNESTTPPTPERIEESKSVTTSVAPPEPTPEPTPVSAPVQEHPIETTIKPLSISEPLRAMNDAVESAIIPTENKEPRIVAPQPPFLPIDAMCFDGSPVVIEHNQNESA